MTDNSTAPISEPIAEPVAAPVRQLPPTLFLPPFNDGEAWLVPEQERVVQLVILTIIFLAGLIIVLAVVEAVFKRCWPNSVFLSSKRRLLRVKYASSEFGFYAEMVFTVLSLCSCALFVYLAVSLQSLAGTEVDPTTIFTQPFVYWIEFGISALFALYYLFMLFTSMSTWKFVLNLWSIAQIVTIIPGLVSIAVQEYYWFFLPLRILQFNRSLKFLKGYGWKLLENRNSQIVFFLSTIFSYLFVATGFIFVSENSITAADGQVNNLLDALYLIVISLSTVGYGDIVPKSALGRVVIMILIVGAIIIIPQELAKLIKIFSSSRNSTYSGELDHVVMYVPDGSDISSFIEEFFHEDRKLQDTNMALVSATDLHENTKALLVKPQYGLRVEVMRGELNSKFDQKRVKMMKARAAFLLTNKNPSSQHDAQTILTALNIASYNKELEVYVQIYSKEHKATALSRGIKHVVCIEELKLGLLAQNCLYLGFSTLIGNMIRSLNASSHKFKYNKWLQDYDYGLGHECYSGRALTPYIGLKFCDVVMYIYRRHEALLFGIKSTPDDTVESVPNSHVAIHVRSEDGSTTANTAGTVAPLDDVFIVLNPGPEYVIQPGDIGFFIAQDERVVDTIVQDELGEYLGPDVWEQTMSNLNLASHSSQWPLDTTDQAIEKRKLALMKSGFNVKTSTGVTRPGPVDEAILSDTEPRSGDSTPREMERERLDLSPGEDRKHRKSDKLTRVKPVKPVAGHARRHSLDSVRDIGAPFSEEFKTREARRSLDMGRSSFSDDQSRDSTELPSRTNSKVHFDASAARDHSLEQQHSDKKKNSSSEQKTRSGSGSKSGKSKLDPYARRTRKKDKILPRLANKEMHGAGHIALDEDLIRNYVLVEDEPNFLSRASLYEVPADMRDHIVIVCDVTSELYTLLLPLRAQSLQARGLYRPVVLFSPRVPTTFHWNRICILPEIYFVRGSPTNTNDLHRAGVSRAWRVLILSSMSLLNYREYLAGEQDCTALDTSVDSTALLTFKIVQAIKNCSATPLVELLCPENSRYIVSVKLKKFNSFDADTLKQIVKSEAEIAEAGEYRNPNYASGQVFYATLLDTLIGQTYFNVDLLDILEELIKPDTVHLVALTDRPQLLTESEGGKSECKLRTFLELFTYFVGQERALPLGIYRKGSGIHNGYVLTVPKKDEVIFVTDKVFLLNQGKLSSEIQAKLQKISEFQDR